MRPAVLHNMSVPPTSRITVSRAAHPGRRFRVSLAFQAGQARSALRRRLGRRGWRAAWDVLGAAGETPPVGRGRRTREALERRLEEAVRRAGIPDGIGVFLEEDVGDARVPILEPAAALAVLARRSGPLYLPSRPLEPSLVDPQPLVLFFPEEAP